ncbi:MAG: hypothetical protein E3J94_07080 [Desulfobacteraceae bacterium]|nr:MAG: hypothetical protein E3J94_07080 [Desulfobacteraceae bacterium]
MPIYFKALAGKGDDTYPAWRYHDFNEPKIVHNTVEDIFASQQGWKGIEPSPLTPHRLRNFGTDFEDLSERQIVLYAHVHFDVDLPLKASKEALVKAIWLLHQGEPAMKDNMVLLAQSAEMNYDETLLEIKKAVKNASDVTHEVIYL